MRRILTGLVVLALAIVAPAADADPAAADGPCNVNEPVVGPFWFASLNAQWVTGTRKVLAVSEPWNDTSWTYLWDQNYNTNQLWSFCVVGYSPERQRNIYQMRLASNPGLCLSDYGQGSAAQLDDCLPQADWQTWQQWELVYLGDQFIPYEGTWASTYAIWNSGSQLCMDVAWQAVDNGSYVITWPCNGQNNQIWF
jgi:hypothetical protein